MELQINNKSYEVIIIKKNIKNLYIRVKDDLKVYVTVNRFTNNKLIESFINDNIDSIAKMIAHQEKLLLKSDYFYYLGNKYNIVLCDQYKSPVILDNYVYVKDKKTLDKFLDKEAKRIFISRFDILFDNFEYKKKPDLIIKKMKRKWGYYNKDKHLICLNKELIKYSIDDIDYVIIHELCHIIHFNHSKSFWNLVEYYKPNYKINKRSLKYD